MTSATPDEVLRAWLAETERRLRQQRSSIDEMNVYPVPDADTGTNMWLTWREAAAAVAADERRTAGDLLGAMARGALLAAQGNSGAILAQMLTAAAKVYSDADPCARHTFTEAWRQAANEARSAVLAPVAGTMLTVADAVAVTLASDAEPPSGAAGAVTDAATGLAQFADRALGAARAALAETPRQLQVLADAHVVDAGGAGLVVVLEGLVAALHGEVSDDTVEVAGGEETPELLAHAVCAVPQGPYEGPAYEVQYLLHTHNTDAVQELGIRLRMLGESVVVAGGGQEGLWRVHVHTDDPAAAIEAGIETGTPSRLTTTLLRAVDPVDPAATGGES